jgi:hypothetical protein
VRVVNTLHVLDKTSVLRGVSSHSHRAVYPHLVGNAWVGLSRSYGIVNTKKADTIADTFQYLTENMMLYFGSLPLFGSSIE